MDVKEFETLMRYDFSQGTEAFAEELLARALEALDASDGVPLTDSDLEMLAAAGNMASLRPDEEF